MDIIRRRGDLHFVIITRRTQRFEVELPIKHRAVIHEPMLGQIDIRKYLATGKIEGVTCGGESGAGRKSLLLCLDT